MLRIAVLVSGSGTNCQALIDAIEAGMLEAEITAIISDRPAGALDRAGKHGIPFCQFSRKSGGEILSTQIMDYLEGKADIIVLAGYLSILSLSFIARWKNKIINIHPSLLPAFGGPGMYGMHVHRAVIDSGEKESGCTVHLVDEGVDTGRILKQIKVPVCKGDTPEILQKRILEKEHLALVEAVYEIASKKIY